MPKPAQLLSEVIVSFQPSITIQSSWTRAAPSVASSCTARLTIRPSANQHYAWPAVPLARWAFLIMPFWLITSSPEQVDLITCKLPIAETGESAQRIGPLADDRWRLKTRLNLEIRGGYPHRSQEELGLAHDVQQRSRALVQLLFSPGQKYQRSLLRRSLGAGYRRLQVLRARRMHQLRQNRRADSVISNCLLNILYTCPPHATSCAKRVELTEGLILDLQLG
jgi:hypothetical protein